MELPVKNAEGTAIIICPICGYCIGATTTPVKGIKVGDGVPYRASLRVFSIEVDENSKSVWIENTGETNIVVRAAIYGPTQMKVKADTSLWEENGGYYYYKQILKPGELTKEGSLVADTKFPEGTDLGPEFEIVVVQECAQAIYDGSTLLPPAGWDYVPQGEA